MNKRQLNEKMEQIVRGCLDDTYQHILFYFKRNFHSKDETILDVINHLLKRESIVQLLGSDEIREAIEDPETAGFYDQIEMAKYVIEEELPEVLEMHEKPKSSKKTKKTEYPKETEADKQRKQEAEVRAEAERANRLRRKREAREEEKQKRYESSQNTVHEPTVYIGNQSGPSYTMKELVNRLNGLCGQKADSSKFREEIDLFERRNNKPFKFEHEFSDFLHSITSEATIRYIIEMLYKEGKITIEQ